MKGSVSFSFVSFSFAAVAFLGCPSAPALQIDIATVPTSAIVFNGTTDMFEFAPANPGSAVGWDFQVTTTVGTSGDSVGLLGRIDGPFTIGAITVNGLMQSAPVTGTGTLRIASPSGDLTANAVWDTVSTLGTGGIINVE